MAKAASPATLRSFCHLSREFDYTVPFHGGDMTVSLSNLSVGFGETAVILCFVLFGIGGTIFWVWALIDCATKEPDTGNTKVAWVVIIALTHWIGAAIYLFVRRPDRLRELGR